MEPKMPAPETRYGHLIVIDSPFRGPGQRICRKDRVHYRNVWWIPCVCELCSAHVDVRWENLRRNLTTRCVDCKRAADTRRFAENSKTLAESRRVKWPWYHKDDAYIYAVAYETAKILKIGYSSNYPANTVVSANDRFRKFMDYTEKGVMVWHKTGASLEDEAIIQGICNKAYGAAFPPVSTRNTRMCEWVNYVDIDETIARIDAAYHWAQQLGEAYIAPAGGPPFT